MFQSSYRISEVEDDAENLEVLNRKLKNAVTRLEERLNKVETLLAVLAEVEDTVVATEENVLYCTRCLMCSWTLSSSKHPNGLEHGIHMSCGCNFTVSVCAISVRTVPSETLDVQAAALGLLGSAAVSTLYTAAVTSVAGKVIEYRLGRLLNTWQIPVYKRVGGTLVKVAGMFEVPGDGD